MIIKLLPNSPLPQQEIPELKISKRSDMLTINGQRLDFRPLADGATLPREAIDCPWIVDDVKRVNGQLIVPILLLCGPSATNAALFPQDIVDPADGNLELPK